MVPWRLRGRNSPCEGIEYVRDDIQSQTRRWPLLVDVPIWIVNCVHKHGYLGTGGGGGLRVGLLLGFVALQEGIGLAGQPAGFFGAKERHEVGNGLERECKMD